MKNSILLLIAVLAFGQAAYSQFTIEQVTSSPFPSELTSSQKGQRIAWAFDVEGRRNIWVAEGPSMRARQLTRFNDDTGQELSDVQFSADGNWIVFVRGQGQNSAEEYPNPAM